jgi:predicted Rossmann fold nucleotide-binding protein DprA/Smf involved in DNA uptake
MSSGSQGRTLRTAAAQLALQALPGVGEQAALHFALRVSEADPMDEHYGGAWTRALAEVEEEIGRCEATGISVLSVFDPGYPRRLAATAHPPVIYVLGSVEALQGERAVALAGGREPGEAAPATTGRLVEVLATGGWTLAAGLDPGVGTAAHVAALAAGMTQVAVMPGGLECTPARSRALVEEIVSGGGAVVSPFRAGLRSSRSTLAGRDRLLVTLARALILTEANEDDGVMHTAIQAAAHDRPVIVAGSGDDGLRALSETPGNQLHRRVAAWKGKSTLAARLGDDPLAERVSAEEPERLLGLLDATPLPEQEGVGPRAWWPGLAL